MANRDAEQTPGSETSGRSAAFDHRQEIASALAHRARAGVVTYISLAVVVAWAIRLERDPGFGARFLAGALLLATARASLVLAERRGAATRPYWQPAFRAVALAGGLFWSANAAWVTASGFDANAVLVSITAAGVAAAGVVSLAPDLWLCRAYAVVMMVPLAGVVAVEGTPQAFGTLAAVVAFTAFLVAQARALHGDFFGALDAMALLKRRAAELEEARGAAEEASTSAVRASQTKSEFLANMSHEIRTPLTAILGYAELLEDSVGVDDRVAFARTIRRNGEHLLRVLSDILDVSKVEAGQMTVEAQESALGPILADVEGLMRGRAVDRPIACKVVLETPIPERVITDATRLRQILFNLVGNAMKFTEKGSVTVRVGYESVRRELTIAVCDTGIGMTPAQLSALFTAFAQVDASSTRRFQGTGLGLFISRQFARLLGGTIEVESAVGQGSTFTLRLVPAVPEDVKLVQGFGQSARPSLPAAPNSGVLAGVRVLLAEDGKDNQRLLSLLLRRAGASVSVVSDGLTAVADASVMLDERIPYDVVLMDMEMPLLDGWGATARLRELGYRGAILALTANATRSARDRCLAAGCDEHVAKPIDTARLLAVVRGAVGRAPLSAPVLRSELRDDPELAVLVDAFCRGLRDQAVILRRGAEADDREVLGDLAHQLAGAGGSYGFPMITDAARRLERAARDALPMRAAAGALIALCERAAAGAPKPSGRAVPAA